MLQWELKDDDDDDDDDDDTGNVALIRMAERKPCRLSH
jgi:hypothetical protein